MLKQNLKKICFHGWINKTQLCFTLFIFYFISLREQSVCSVVEKINISEFVLFPHRYCKYKNPEFECLLQNYMVPLLMSSICIQSTGELNCLLCSSPKRIWMMQHSVRLKQTFRPHIRRKRISRSKKGANTATHRTTIQELWKTEKYQI